MTANLAAVIAWGAAFLLVLVSAALFIQNSQPSLAQRQSSRRPAGLRMPDTLAVGDLAPDFRLKTKDGKHEISLSSFRGKKPVVLIFGSYT